MVQQLTNQELIDFYNRLDVRRILRRVRKHEKEDKEKLEKWSLASRS